MDIKPITMETLRRMTPEGRSRLYARAIERRDAGGQSIIDLIDSSGLPLRSGGMAKDDPIYLRIEEVVWSKKGRETCIAATERGLPALAGVEPLIRAELGALYTSRDMGTVSAGSIVGELMRHLGYVDTKPADMPAGSVAKTAMMWKAK